MPRGLRDFGILQPMRPRGVRRSKAKGAQSPSPTPVEDSNASFRQFGAFLITESPDRNQIPVRSFPD